MSMRPADMFLVAAIRSCARSLATLPSEGPFLPVRGEVSEARRKLAAWVQANTATDRVLSPQARALGEGAARDLDLVLREWPAGALRLTASACATLTDTLSWLGAGEP